MPAAGSWNCSLGILRIDLVKADTVSNAAFTTGTDAITKTIFMVPTYSGGATTFSTTAGTGSGIADTQCSAGSCTMTIGVDGSTAQYYARITTIYQNAGTVTLKAQTTAGPAALVGGQATIDSTGQAQDVLRRIQVRIPLNGNAAVPPLPVSALQSTDSICKQLIVSLNVYVDKCNAGVVPAPPGVFIPVPGDTQTGAIQNVDVCWQNAPGIDWLRPSCWDPSIKNQSVNAAGTVKSCTWVWTVTNGVNNGQTFTHPYDSGDPNKLDPQCQYGNTDKNQFTPTGTPADGVTTYCAVLTNYFVNGTTSSSKTCGGMPY